MSKQHKIIIGILIGAILVFFILRMVGKSILVGYEAGKQDIGSTPIASAIPVQIQRELAYFNEGESVNYQGKKYTVIGGQWVIN